ncbi:MAG: carbamoyl transferase, partial [Candidatus Methylomirabilis sp.]|nr:carbamoyl transferase [Deltaproteobacteria bacterium]
RRRELKHIYYGPEFSDAEMGAAAAAAGLPYERLEDPAARAAELLVEGKILGWFQGRMEFGPRALGNRSLLADPRRADMKDVMNARVKRREGFRPFAPSVLAEKCGEWFVHDAPSPFMLMVYPLRPEKLPLVPAIAHVDGTGRVQTVTRDTNPLYHRLIEEFERRTGVPMVLNTSFNVRGEPIVCTPEDAIACFKNTDFDCLILGRHLLRKSAAA